MFTKIFYYIGWLGIILAGLMLLLFLYWNLYPYKTITLNKPIQTDKLVYQAGDTLAYDMNYCKHTTKQVEISKRFVDGVAHNAPNTTAFNPTGCREVRVTMDVPNIPTGTYTLELNYTYQVNPARSITIQFKTNKFKVVEGDE